MSSKSQYEFNYIDIHFNKVFNFNEFGNIIEKICEVNNISRGFIYEIIKNHSDPNYIYHPIKDDKQTNFSNSSYTYFKKLTLLINSMTSNKSTLLRIVTSDNQVNPDLLMFDE